MFAPALKYDPGIWPLLSAAALSVLLAAWIWPRRHVPGGRPLLLALVLYSAGAIFRSGMLSVTSFGLQVALRTCWGVAVTWEAVATLWRSLDYAGLAERFFRLPLAWSITFVPAVILTALYLTNPVHAWVWAAVWNDGGVRSSLGPAGYASLAWAFSLAVASIAVSGRVALLSGGLLRRQATVLTLGTVVGLLSVAGDSAWHNHLYDSRASSALWIVAAATVAVALFRMKAIDLSPIARHAVVEHMADGVLVLDAKDRILDANPAAARLFSVRPSRIIGQHVGAAFRDTPALVDLLMASRPPSTQPPPVTSAVIRAGAIGSPVREIEVQLPSAPFPGRAHGRETPGERIVLCRDVTELRAAQASLECQRLAMAALQERERLARELHDGLAQVLAFVKFRVQLAADALDQDRPRAARSDLEGVGDVLQLAHQDVRDFLLSARTGWHTSQNLAEQIANFIEGFSSQHPFTINTVWRMDPAALHLNPEAQVQVLRIIQESLINSQRHSQAGAATLEFDCRDALLHVIVRDDGVGFDISPVGEQAGGAGHYGLRFMRDRAEAVNGTLNITSRRGVGTEVHLIVPIAG